YCKASGIHFAVSKGAYLTVRLSPQSIRLQEQDGSPFELLARLQSINKTGELGAWKVWIPLQGHYPLAARLCVLRKSKAAIALAQKKARRKSRKNGYQQLQSETLFYAQFVMVLSTFPKRILPLLKSYSVIVTAGRSSWSLSVSNRSLNLVICPNTMTKA